MSYYAGAFVRVGCSSLPDHYLMLQGVQCDSKVRQLACIQ